MEIQDNNIVNKLIVLFFMDKMDVPMEESIILEAFSTHTPAWLEYMDCIHTLDLLLKAGFIYNKKTHGQFYYSITPDGRACLSYFYMRIPASLRSEITEFVKENRAVFRRKQEYPYSYHLNPDKTCTCTLKIVDSMKTTLDLKINVANKAIAIAAAEKWQKKAAEIYAILYEQLVD